MIFICEKCYYMFSLDEAPVESNDNRYRCPDCGKFTVRPASSEECIEYFNRQIEKEEV